MPSFEQGYWIKKIDRQHGITLLRYDGEGWEPKQYFLSKIENGNIMISDLPRWISNNRMHVYLSLEIVKKYGSVPPVIMKKGTTIALIKIPYRLPPEEEAFVNMHSWPMQYDGEDRAFNRIISLELYDMMKSLFIGMGFEIQEDLV